MIAQILAIAIFLVMFLMIVMEKIERHYVTLGCGLLMLVLVFGICMHSPQAIMDTLNLQSIFTVEARRQNLQQVLTGQRFCLSPE